jgi:hypothetical protein
LDIVSGLGLLAILGGGLLLTEAAIRRTDVGAGLVLVVTVFREVYHLDTSIDVGPVLFGVRDALFVVLATAAVARLLRTERLLTQQKVILAFGVLISWALARGFGSFATVAIAESRKFLYFAAIALYFSTMEPRRDLVIRIGRLWVIAASLLAVLVVLRWGATAVGFQVGTLASGGGFRVVPSDIALLIGQGSLFAFVGASHRAPVPVRFIAPALLLVTLILQHRTVWLTVAAGLLYVIWKLPNSRKFLGVLVLGMTVFAGLMLTFIDNEEVAEDLLESGQSTGTLEWRVAGWVALLEQNGPEDAVEIIAGRPFGTGWDRTFDGRFVDVTPHSFYMESFLRVGWLGVLLWVGLYLTALQRTTVRFEGRTQDRASVGPSEREIWYLMRAVLAGQLVYFLTYTPDVSQSMLFGIACALTGAMSRTATREHATPAGPGVVPGAVS